MKCENNEECEWKSGEDAVCEPPTTTSSAGCCGSLESEKKHEMCAAKESEHKCERNGESSGCYWNEGEEAECPPPVFTTTTEEEGCCDSDNIRKFDMCNAKE